MSALNGFRIVELAETVCGEYCGKLLSDFGADVVKIERPGLGSPTRSLGPFAPRGADPERSGLFAYLNTNKNSVVLDLATADGVATLGGLVQHADAVIDDHPAGWLEGVGLDPASFQEDRPRLVLCAITAYGQSPLEDRLHAEDLTLFHDSGWGYHTPGGGDNSTPPLNGPGRFLPSYEAGFEAALCIAAALFDRELSNAGQFIDISKHAVMASRTDYVLGQMVAGDMEVSDRRSAFDLRGPSGIFGCRDGHVYVWMSTPSHWTSLGQLLGDPEWMHPFPERWLENGCTPERVAECRRHIAEWLAPLDLESVSVAAQKRELTLVPLHSVRDLVASPQYGFRKFFAEVSHPVLGPALYPTVPYRLSATPASIVSPAPLLGRHTAERLAASIGASRSNAEDGSRGQATTSHPRGGPLQGVRVVELTKVWAGPFTGKLLAFLGAEVIKIESLGALDVTRAFGVADIDKAPAFQAVNPQKLSVQIDLKRKEGVALVLDLLGKSDILVENLRPGAIRRLGLGYEAAKAVRPDIVFVSMGMYGDEGPLSDQTGYAPFFAALSGMSRLVGPEGGPPVGMSVRYGDSTYGTAAAFAAIVALIHRRRTGVGQFIDVSAVETLTTMFGDRIMDFTLNGTVPESRGNRHAEMAPHGVYPCRGGEWLSLAVSSDHAWRAMAEAMNRSDLADHPHFARCSDRKANEGELDRLVAEWTVNRGADELVAKLQASGVAAAKSRSSIDMAADPQLWARGFFPEVIDRAGAARPIVGPSWRMSRGAGILDGAPRLGEHTRHVLGDILGLSADMLRELESAGITR